MARSSVTRPPSMKGAKDALGVLSRPGPNRVRFGDLGLIGLPGIVYTPAEGYQLPAVVLGHAWLQPVRRYHELLRHLATWGIVAAAPNTQRGPVPSLSRFSSDLDTVLDVCAGVRLGDGRISVDARRTALIGHGTGGGAAILTAARRERLGALVTLAPSEIQPSAIEAAARVGAPTLHLAAEVDSLAPAAGHAERIAAAQREAGADVTLRSIEKAGHLGFCEGRHWSSYLLQNRPQHRTRKITRALVTAFLMQELLGEKRVSALTSGDVPGAPIVEPPDPEAEQDSGETHGLLGIGS
ncbi:MULTISPECIES: dienelactone hydrolase family protein [unclassified Pseudonocardia]|uniref:dienelactone hydrolase family protein n=1 Tax=unclassified Pseudonocardia TaxID=2619320 RepID=UPI001D05A934|nr:MULTISPECIES: dienelactone hydrolase family protein [unclassified Pseudonocardia]